MSKVEAGSAPIKAALVKELNGLNPREIAKVDLDNENIGRIGDEDQKYLDSFGYGLHTLTMNST